MNLAAMMEDIDRSARSGDVGGEFAAIDSGMAALGALRPDGSYAYTFGAEWLPRVRSLGWRFGSRVRTNHEERADLEPAIRGLVPDIILDVPRKTLRSLRTKLLGGIFEVDVSVSTGASWIEPSVSHYVNKDGMPIVDPSPGMLKKLGAALTPVADDAREVMFMEVKEAGHRHDNLIYRGTLYGHNAMEHRVGDSFRLTAQWRMRSEGKKSFPCLEMISIRPYVEKPRFTPELAARMAPGEDAMAHLRKLARSIAPATGDAHLAPKVSCLLSCVNSVPLQDERPNVHTLLIGPPASGKTAISRPLAESMVAGGRFLDASRTSAPGLTYAETTIAGALALTPGAFVTAPLIVMDEFDSTKAMDDLKMLIESQVVSYEKRLKGYRSTDCSIIGTCNPDDDRWSYELTIAENLTEIPFALLSRFNLFLMPPEADSREGHENLYNSMCGLDAAAESTFSRADMAAYIAHARTLQPEITSGCTAALLDYLEENANKKILPEVSELYGKRLAASLLRNACALARLLLRETVDESCAKLAIWLLGESLRSFHAKSANAFRQPSSKQDIVIQTAQDLNRLHPSGWPIEAATGVLVQYPNHFRSEGDAKEYILSKCSRHVWQKRDGVYQYVGDDAS